MYERLTVDLFHLHPPMALNAHSFGFHMVSCKYIPSYAIFYHRVEQFHDATWVGVNSDWMSQLLYEWQKFMNNTYPFFFSDPWRSYTFQQSWKVSNDIAIVNIYTTSPWMCIYYCPIHIRDHCEWSQDIPSHITLTLFLNQWHSSIFMSYISSYNKSIVFSRWSWILGNLIIHWNKMEIHQTKNLNKAISTPYLLGATSKLTAPTARPYSCPNLGIWYGIYQVHGASSSWK